MHGNVIYSSSSFNKTLNLRGPGGGGWGGGLHQNSLEIDFIVVSGRRE